MGLIILDVTVIPPRPSGPGAGRPSVGGEEGRQSDAAHPVTRVRPRNESRPVDPAVEMQERLTNLLRATLTNRPDSGEGRQSTAPLWVRLPTETRHPRPPPVPAKTATDLTAVSCDSGPGPDDGADLAAAAEAAFVAVHAVGEVGVEHGGDDQGRQGLHSVRTDYEAFHVRYEPPVDVAIRRPTPVACRACCSARIRKPRHLLYLRGGGAGSTFGSRRLAGALAAAAGAATAVPDYRLAPEHPSRPRSTTPCALPGLQRMAPPAGHRDAAHAVPARICGPGDRLAHLPGPAGSGWVPADSGSGKLRRGSCTMRPRSVAGGGRDPVCQAEYGGGLARAPGVTLNPASPARVTKIAAGCQAVTVAAA